MLDERLNRAVMNLRYRQGADKREKLIQVHGNGIGRGLFCDLSEVPQGGFPERKYRGIPSCCFLLQFRQAAD
jgi:hypothetical protein